MIRVGLIGAGFMGVMHASCYGALRENDVFITAVADVREEKASKIASAHGATVYGTGIELIESADVDIIDICLPTYLHSGHAVAAMEKGRAVFIEKPVCLGIGESELMLRTQKKTGTSVMTGHCIRFWPEYMWLKETLASGIYGRIVSAIFSRVSPKPLWSWENWLHRVERSGSAALDLHIHDSDFIRYLLGEPEGVSSTAVRDDTGAIQHIMTSYEYPDMLVSAEGAWDYPPAFPFRMEYRVKFEKATVVYSCANNPALVVYGADGSVLTPDAGSVLMENKAAGGNVSGLGGYYNELKYFTDRVAFGAAVEEATLEEGIKSLELVLREIESAGGMLP
ncbi:MAG: Gfo/Idh/MocA family oxidoreductase [Clostridia bacterium]|nr:Gfo/Idh/MocA family oxidoreductase [Clostridia bacterium]